jgi:Zn finger protein HypA/HybF involved in hydrogenase expression
MSLEIMCQKCKCRLDPLMTRSEADYFILSGCPMCHQKAWVIVEGIYEEVRV